MTTRTLTIADAAQPFDITSQSGHAKSTAWTKNYYALTLSSSRSGAAMGEGFGDGIAKMIAASFGVVFSVGLMCGMLFMWWVLS